MKKRVGLFLFIATVLGCITFNSKTLVVNAGANEYAQPATNYDSINNDIPAFYTSTSAGSVEGLKGDALLEQLAKVLEVNHKYYNNYGELRGGLPYSDEDPENKSNIYYFYSGVSHSNAWGGGSIYNREHVWPKANSNNLFKSVDNSGRGAGADIHHLRPEDAGVNSTRSNHPFADLNKSGTEIKYNGTSTGSYLKNSKFEPRDGVKGDVARILMYMYTHYSTEVSENTDRASISDSKTASKTGALDITNVVYTSTGTDQAAWDLLIKWNNFDPVDAFEMNRNNYCTKVTGVRNPFIDHPEFATMIWDTSYSGTGALLDNSFNDTEEHEYKAVDEVPATCTTDGMSAHYSCTHCDKLFTRSGTSYFVVSESSLIIPAGHNYQAVNQVNASCTVNGTKAHYTCSNCDKIFSLSGTTYTEISADSLVINAAHSYGNLVKATTSTCKSNGMSAHYKCSKCNLYFDSSKQQTTKEALTLPLVDHTYNLVNEEPSSCTSEGKMAHYTCNTCDKLFVKNNETYVETTEQDLIVSKNPHDYKFVEEVKSTCENEGKMAHYTCNTCDGLFIKNNEEYVTTTQENLIIPISHNLGELVEATGISCQQGGMKAHYQCVDCNRYFTEEKVETTFEALQIPQKGHTYGSKIDKVEATCEKAGVKAHYQCQDCKLLFIYTGGSYVEVTLASLAIPKLNHEMTTINKVDATCTTNGLIKHYSCSSCNHLYIIEDGQYVKVTQEQLVIVAGDHQYQLVEGITPTCLEKGLKEHYKCEECEALFILENEVYTEISYTNLILDEKDHSYGQEIAKVDATCETSGNVAYYECEECNKLFIKAGSSYIGVSNEEVNKPAFGHSYYKVNGKQPTCTQNGLKEHYKCSKCDKVFFLVNDQYVATTEDLTLQAIEHTYDNDCDVSCNTCNQLREVGEHIDENKDNKCDKCETKLENTNKKKTRNIIFISIGGVSLLGLAFLLIFKRF